VKVYQYDFVENRDLYLEVVSTRVKAFIPLPHMPVGGILVERPW
jgi:hypothetical protein